MKLTLIKFIFLLFIPVSVQSQSFNGGEIGNVDNWTGGLPTDPSSPGTINTDGTFGNLTNLYIIQQSGAVTRNGITQNLDGGAYTLEGGSLSTRSINVRNGALFTIGGGTFTISESNRDLNIGRGTGISSSLIIRDGSTSIGRDLEVFDGATFTISGGSLDIGRDLGNRNFHDPGEFYFNGGTTTAQFLSFGTASTMHFGGTSNGYVGWLLSPG